MEAKQKKEKDGKDKKEMRIEKKENGDVEEGIVKKIIIKKSKESVFKVNIEKNS